VYTIHEILEDREIHPKKIIVIGGPAAVFAVPGSVSELSNLISVCENENIPYFILGKGSNILVSDSGFDGCVIDMTPGFSEVKVSNGMLSAGSGCLISAVAKAASDNSLSGFEELAGIPGTIGGALVMNAGCYGREISELVHSVSVMTEGEERGIEARDIKFGYRYSGLKGEVITGAVFSLKSGLKQDIGGKMQKYAEMRRAKQPVNLPSCGSVFKRPASGFAGALIEECGLKGKAIGGAMVSELHAGFIVNTGNATASDVLNLIRLIRNTVFNCKGVRLEEEVIYLGFKEEDLI
jgi:UDP-N-acetylmuramate dehydrogenase